MSNPQGVEFLSIPLTNFSVAQMQSLDNFIARRTIPTIPVDQQGSQYYTYPKGEWARNDAKPLGRGAESAGGGWTLSDDTYFCIPYAFHKDNDNQDYANASATRIINLDQDATDYVTRKMLILEDAKLAATLMPDTGSPWDVNKAGTGAVPDPDTEFTFWDDPDATPVEDITNEIIAIHKRTGGFRPNNLILTPEAYNTLRNHPSIIGRFQYTKPIVNAEMLAAIFDLPKVTVAWSIVNTASEGLTDDFDNIFGANALLAYFGSGPGPKQETAAAMFSWTAMDGASALGTRIDRIPAPLIHSTRIEGTSAFDIKIIDSAAATLFTGVLSS